MNPMVIILFLSIHVAVILTRKANNSLECYQCDEEYDSNNTLAYLDCFLLNATSPKKTTCKLKKECFETFGRLYSNASDEDSMDGYYVKRDCALVTGGVEHLGCTSFGEHSGAKVASGFICRCNTSLCNSNSEAYDVPGGGGKMSLHNAIFLFQFFLAIGKPKCFVNLS